MALSVWAKTDQATTTGPLVVATRDATAPLLWDYFAFSESEGGKAKASIVEILRHRYEYEQLMPMGQRVCLALPLLGLTWCRAPRRAIARWYDAASLRTSVQVFYVPVTLSAETTAGSRFPEALVQAELALLEGFGKLEEDWDSYGAAKISAAAIDAAYALIVVVADQLGDVLGDRVRPYVVAPVADGGTYIEWRGPGGKLQVHVGPQGGLRYLLVPPAIRQARESARATRNDVLDAVRGVLGPRAGL